MRRLRLLRRMKYAVEFSRGDGIDLVRTYALDSRAVFFIAPPYIAGKGKRAGRRLYNHNQLNHGQLFQLMAACAGQFLMTYDNDQDVMSMARDFGFQVERVPMKNTHHEEKFELVITRGSRAPS